MRLHVMGSTLLAACLMGQGAHAQDCDAIRAQIDSKIRARGVTQFSLNVVDNAATERGKVVGSCGRGSRKIVYRLETAAAAAGPGVAASPAAASSPMRAPQLLTECKDGTVSVGGDCRKR